MTLSISVCYSLTTHSHLCPSLSLTTHSHLSPSLSLTTHSLTTPSLSTSSQVPSEDRNRTSPFPYGGHRFEFRAVGSSQVSRLSTCFFITQADIEVVTRTDRQTHGQTDRQTDRQLARASVTTMLIAQFTSSSTPVLEIPQNIRQARLYNN